MSFSIIHHFSPQSFMKNNAITILENRVLNIIPVFLLILAHFCPIEHLIQGEYHLNVITDPPLLKKA